MKFLAFVLIEVHTGKLNSVVKNLKNIEEVKEIYPTTGPYDIITSVSTSSLIEMRKLVTDIIHNVDGVQKTTTCIVSE